MSKQSALYSLSLPIAFQMCTPWGTAQVVDKLSPDATVVRVSTAEHGGIGIQHEMVSIPQHLRFGAIYDQTWAWFEEDEAAALAVLVVPHFFSNEYQECAKETMRNSYPDAYEKHFGEKLEVHQSRELQARELAARTHNLYTPSTAWGDWAWDVPRGFVYVLGYRRSDESTAGFLVPKDRYRPPHNLIILDEFPRWTPDKSQPQSKPKGWDKASSEEPQAGVEA
jgi:hypothetical protein